MFKNIIKQCFRSLLTKVVNASNHSKFVSLNNHQSITQPTLIHLNEFN